ncbi:MAG: type II CAAX endopeptidase family protein [Caldilineaceae bacterium]
MSIIVKKYPALSLLILAMLFGTAPLLAVNLGLLPASYDQLGALSASLAGIVLAAVEGRKHGVRKLLGRVLIWRVGLWWWAFVLFFPILPAVATLYLYHLFGGPAVDWSGLKPLSSVVPMILFLTIAAGMGEEFGWRGFALPRLQARHNALVASLIVGVIWSSWHLPLFLTKGTIQYEWKAQVGLLPAVLAYSLYVTAESIQCTWVFNNTKGSVLVAAVMHGALNAWNQSIDVYRGHFGGILTYMLVMVTVSLLIALWAGSTNLSRTKERNVLVPEDDLSEQIAATPIAI